MARIVSRRSHVITMTDANVAYRLGDVDLVGRFTSDFNVYVSSGNTAAQVYVGDSTVDATWIPWAKGSVLNYVSGSGAMAGTETPLGFDLSKFYVMSPSAGDTVIVEYAAFVKL